MKRYLPNQSGTHGNRTNFHDAETEEKIFVVEFHTEDIEERLNIVRLIRAAPDLLEALQKAVADYGNEGGPWNVPIEPGTWIDLARKAIDKASNH